MVFFEALVLGIGLCTISFALPTSLLEDMKDAQLQAPIRANKVKRAQEFIMFGNQQNRASTYGNSKTEKRATVIDDNSLAEDEVPMPTLMSDFDDHVYNNNQLGNGKEDDRSQLSRELYYNLLLRNLDLTQNLHNEPAYNLELPYYNIMDSRSKREAKVHKPKKNLRMKREYISQDDIMLLKLLENMNRKSSDPRNHNRWSTYENNGLEDYNDADEDYGGSWFDGPVYNQGEKEVGWAMPHNGYAIYKRSDGSMKPFMPFQPHYDERQMHRRYLH